MTTPREHKIVVSPFDGLNASLLNDINRGITGTFGYSVDVHPLLKDLDFALDPDRNQYHSTSILDELSRLLPTGALKVLAICKVDLFIPILTHVYGEARLGGKTCVISIHRLKENISAMNPGTIFHYRVVKEAIHELGHTFGLRHCEEHSCVMHYARTVMDVDRKSDQPCRYCKVLLDDEKKRLSKN